MPFLCCIVLYLSNAVFNDKHLDFLILNSHVTVELTKIDGRIFFLLQVTVISVISCCSYQLYMVQCKCFDTSFILPSCDWFGWVKKETVCSLMAGKLL
jgi:hypothetical protein